MTHDSTSDREQPRTQPVYAILAALRRNLARRNLSTIRGVFRSRARLGRIESMVRQGLGVTKLLRSSTVRWFALVGFLCSFALNAFASNGAGAELAECENHRMSAQSELADPETPDQSNDLAACCVSATCGACSASSIPAQNCTFSRTIEIASSMPAVRVGVPSLETSPPFRPPR